MTDLIYCPTCGWEPEVDSDERTVLCLQCEEPLKIYEIKEDIKL